MTHRLGSVDSRLLQGTLRTIDGAGRVRLAGIATLPAYSAEDEAGDRRLPVERRDDPAAAPWCHPTGDPGLEHAAMAVLELDQRPLRPQQVAHVVEAHPLGLHEVGGEHRRGATPSLRAVDEHRPAVGELVVDPGDRLGQDGRVGHGHVGHEELAVRDAVRVVEGEFGRPLRPGVQHRRDPQRGIAS